MRRNRARGEEETSSSPRRAGMEGRSTGRSRLRPHADRPNKTRAKGRQGHPGCDEPARRRGPSAQEACQMLAKRPAAPGVEPSGVHCLISHRANVHQVQPRWPAHHCAQTRQRAVILSSGCVLVGSGVPAEPSDWREDRQHCWHFLPNGWARRLMAWRLQLHCCQAGEVCSQRGGVEECLP